MPTKRRRRKLRRELPPRAKVLFGISDPASLIGALGGFRDEREAREAWEHHREEIIPFGNRHRESGELFVPPPFWVYDAPHIDSQRKRVRDDSYWGGWRDVESDQQLANRFGLRTVEDLIRYRKPKNWTPPDKD